MIKMSDVADAANVSVKTVSRVINGKPYVREEVKDRVLYMIDALGYCRNSAGKMKVERQNPSP